MKHIALISPNQAAWSETFIRAQAERLPANTHFLYGAFLPRFRPDGQHFISNWTLLEGWAYTLDRIRKRPVHTTLRARIARYLQEAKIEAVLAQYGPSGVEMMGICADLGIPLIVHFHGFDVYDRELLAEYGRRYPQLLQKAAAVIAVSRDMEQKLLDMGAPRERLHYNPCGADTDLFQATDPGKNPPHFFAAGRFSETKSPHLLVEAFRQVHAEVPEARLTIAGDGVLLPECKAAIQKHGLGEAVTLAGVLPHPEIAAHMAKSRAFVQHSVTTASGDSEGTPVAIMEAGAAGLPVISTRHAGIPDVVRHAETGLLVEEHDLDALAQAMIHLAKDPALATRLGTAARTRIHTEFSLQSRLDHLWQIIEAAIAHPKAAKTRAGGRS